MSAPFVGALTGTQYIPQFPVNVPPYAVSPRNPDSNVNWARYTPISGAGSVWYQNKTPYTMSLNFSIDRQVGSNMLATVSYIGSESRHLLAVVGANPGIPSLCLSLSQPQDVAPGSPTCGPFLESNVFTRADGTVVNGTRAPFPNTIGTDAWYKNMGNANYNAFTTRVVVDVKIPWSVIGQINANGVDTIVLHVDQCVVAEACKRYGQPTGKASDT